MLLICLAVIIGSRHVLSKSFFFQLVPDFVSVTYALDAVCACRVCVIHSAFVPSTPFLLLNFVAKYSVSLYPNGGREIGNKVKDFYDMNRKKTPVASMVKNTRHIACSVALHVLHASCTFFSAFRLTVAHIRYYFILYIKCMRCI